MKNRNCMKQTVSFAMAFLLAASVMGGCGSDKQADSDTPASETEAAVSTENTSAETGSTEEANTADTDDSDTFVFTRDNFPRMDGSTSLAPLARAVASVLLGESTDDVSDLVNFNKTTQSYRNLMNGECDILFASEPNAVVFDEMAEAGFAYEIEPIATEALVFVVNSDNPVDNLTTEQIQKIYTGEITNWKEVGGEDLAIVPFQRNSGAGSQALMEKLVMKDLTIMESPEEYVVTGMGELMEAVKSYDNSADAIGYSVYYYANDMRMADGLKIISVDGVEPSDDTIRSGEYPFTNAYYCVIGGDAAADSPARILYDWIVSPDGQLLTAGEGYVSIQ